MRSFSAFGWTIRYIVLVVLFIVFFIGGSLTVSGLIPDVKSDPGMLSNEIGILVIALANTLLVMGLVLSSRWSGWKLALGLAFAYYGAVTFVMQIETWYFLSDITVGDELLPRLFMMGIPVAVFYVPLAVWILGKGQPKANSAINPVLEMPVKEWIWKLITIALVYLALYWTAGYFIGWQNPELRAFYGSPGEGLSFWRHTIDTLRTNPGLFMFQLLRAMIWTLFALPVIRGSKVGVWQTAFLVGLLFSIPQNIGHILENPLIPIASVRLTHMVETASSTFIFGMIVTWLLYREQKSVRNLFKGSVIS
ncbi:MAG: hypothetical protein APF76_12625 [Desulfitibacter sp. BRH_c19]|nr:MAG: hypothetical protein APF76_12625 [Desulfitibacter sp. BRH_c19]